MSTEQLNRGDFYPRNEINIFFCIFSACWQSQGEIATATAFSRRRTLQLNVRLICGSATCRCPAAIRRKTQVDNTRKWGCSSGLRSENWMVSGLFGYNIYLNCEKLSLERMYVFEVYYEVGKEIRKQQSKCGKVYFFLLCGRKSQRKSLGEMEMAKKNRLQLWPVKTAHWTCSWEKRRPGKSVAKCGLLSRLRHVNTGFTRFLWWPH